MRFRGMMMGTLLLALAACSGLSGPVELEGVSAEVKNDRLTVANGSTDPAPIYWAAFEEGTAAANPTWSPCVNPGSCARIDRGGSATTPLANVAGWQPGDRGVVVYWWRLVPDDLPGRFKADVVRTMRISTN